MSTPRLRQVLRDLDRYRPGRRPAPGQRDVARLASNELPFSLDSGIARAISDGLTESNRYPDPTSTELTAALASRYDVDASRVVVGCGSVQLLQELIAATCNAGDEVVYGWRSFEAYPTLTRLAGATPRPVPLVAGHIDLGAVRRAVSAKTRLVILCSPNNPIGPTLSHADVREFLLSLPGDVVVALDEAYAEYVTEPCAVQGLRLLEQFPNLVVLRTFSKAYGLAGLRVGYGFAADPAVAAALRQVHLPFAVSLPAQLGALAALAAEEGMLTRVARSVEHRDVLARGLRDAGWHVPDAQGNFVWLPAGDGSEVVDDRFCDAGVLTRCFPGEGVRITVGTPSDNERVLRIASAWAGALSL
jgi:histidinol-phosphate aminotransferase